MFLKVILVLTLALLARAQKETPEWLHCRHHECTEEDHKPEFVCSDRGLVFKNRCFFNCADPPEREAPCTGVQKCMNEECSEEEKAFKTVCDEYGQRHESACKMKCDGRKPGECKKFLQG